jgi:hypothetical protein
MTTKESKTGSDEAGSVPQYSEARAGKKPYRSPELRDWGSILELTAGAIFFDVSDGDFSGSGGG